MPNEESTEDRLIASLFARHSADGESVLEGPGDDAAVVRCPAGEELLITVDTLNEGVHFPAGAPAHSIGHRALAVSLSDLAAMGARPLWAVVTLSVPAAEADWLEDFAGGLFTLADRFGVRIVGGDLARGPLTVTVAAHGSARRSRILSRTGAGAGDGIWVSGFLGDAAAGLTVLRERLKLASSATEGSHRAGLRQLSFHETGKAGPLEEALTRRFCYPYPLVELGLRLPGIASACMDLSDGLAVDLPRLLRSNGLAARVRLEQAPISRELRAFADLEQARRLAICGGDDYELLFAVPAALENRLDGVSPGVPLTRIGETHEGEGLEITCNGQPWDAGQGAFSHFA